MDSHKGQRKRRKYVGQVCYMCGSQSPVENEDIPGKQFGVTAETGGFIVPSCRRCNTEWSPDQEFVRLRLTLHAGSKAGTGYIKGRELARIKAIGQREPQIGRYLKERKKQYVAGGIEYLGLTDVDLEHFRNVALHWAAGIHYWKRKARAALPGSVQEKLTHHDIFRKITTLGRAHGNWRLKGGEIFGIWWFFPGPHLSESITIFNLLDSDELWFLVRFHNYSEGRYVRGPRGKWENVQAVLGGRDNL